MVAYKLLNEVRALAHKQGMSDAWNAIVTPWAQTHGLDSLYKDALEDKIHLTCLVLPDTCGNAASSHPISCTGRAGKDAPPTSHEAGSDQTPSHPGPAGNGTNDSDGMSVKPCKGQPVSTGASDKTPCTKPGDHVSGVSVQTPAAHQQPGAEPTQQLNPFGQNDQELQVEYLVASKLQ